MSAPNTSRSVHVPVLRLTPRAYALLRVLDSLGLRFGGVFTASYEWLSQLLRELFPGSIEGDDELIAEAALELFRAGYVRRRRTQNRRGHDDGPGTPYEWTLLDRERAAPRWAAGEEFIEAARARSAELGLKPLFVLERLTHSVREDGRLALDAELMQSVTGFEQRTALKHIDSLIEHRAGVVCLVTSRRPKCWTIELAVPTLEVVPNNPLAAGDAQEEEAPKKLWYPEMVERLIARAEGPLPAGTKLSNVERTRRFVWPVLECQARWEGNPAFVKYALSEAVDDNPGNFAAWLRAVERRHAHRFRKPTYKTNAAAAYERSPEGLRAHVVEALNRCVELVSGPVPEVEAAQQLWKELFTSELRQRVADSFFGGDARRATAMLLLALKFGTTHFEALDAVEDDLGLDLLPEWRWPADLPAHRRWEADRQASDRAAWDEANRQAVRTLADEYDSPPPWDELNGHSGAPDRQLAAAS